MRKQGESIADYIADYKAVDCFYRDKECFVCRKKGHMSRVCSLRKKAGKTVNKLDQGEGSSGSSAGGVSGDGSVPSGASVGFQFGEFVPEDCFFVHRTAVRKESPILVDVQVNCSSIQMELDTGASISVAGKCELEKAVACTLRQRQSS